MSIGAGILLFVVGAVLRFALNVEVSWLDLPLVGNLLMGAGVLIFVLGLVFTFRRRRTVSTRRTVGAQGEVDGITKTTREVDDTDI
ncbi:hypothetical protein KRR55_11220 [Paeniglutamicibacter sp. ABSL32-1]|uniref:DUF6458 family protein n=1 Tax=Paeniglutamicibacter quisquiliarum TaxID=2849498 RepID=UPI001C2D745B|nr:DUF6458 family protein [Paeniglutamicibacter quisquiliarum]MBV1779680.1 hypothetical protein [Paeniglutamicibacter quisquiliarum]